MPTFPTEVFEVIIDFSWPDRPTLRACALTCRAWAPRSRYNLFYSIDFRSTKQARRFSRLLSSEPHLSNLVKELDIAPDPTQVVGLAGSFPFAVARKLPKVEHLCLYRIQQFPCVTPTFLSTLSLYQSITRLEITMTRFPSLTVFGRILLAIPSLSFLICASVKWCSANYVPSAFRPSAGRVKLRCMAISYFEWSNDLVDWLLAIIAIDRLNAINLRRIRIEDTEHVKKFLEGVGPSLHHLAIGMEAAVEDQTLYAGLAHNTQLRTFHFDFRVECGWIFVLLSQIPSARIHRLTISTAVKIGKAEMDKLQCDRIDELLSSSKLAVLDAVVFQYLPRMTTDWINWWRSETERRFPRLCARGLVRVECCREWWYICS